MKSNILGRNEQMRQSIEISGLVLLAKQDTNYFKDIFEMFFLPVHNFVLSQVGDYQSTEDIVSQTFLSALESLNRYEEKGLFTAWIFTIARSKIKDFFRKQKRIIDYQMMDIPAPKKDFLAVQIESEEIRNLRLLIQELPYKKRELILLRYVANLSFNDIGGIVGKSEGAVKKAIYRILDHLKNELEINHA